MKPFVQCPPALPPHQPSVGPLSPYTQTREYYLLVPLLGGGRRSLGHPPLPSPSSARSESQGSCAFAHT